MFRVALWSLRQRRYRALAGFMALVALVCAGMGTFEIHRFESKRHDNAELRANAHAAAVVLTPALVPLVHEGAGPDAVSVRYRTVVALGAYEPAGEEYVGNQSQGGRQGYFVLTPFRTSAGTVLVVRGFVAATASGSRPAAVAAPPSGSVRILARLQTPQTSDDQQGRLGSGEITSINPVQQSGRLGQPVYQAYVTLDPHRPGTSGVQAVPPPSLSNPTGGASELQLLSYVVQWYAFMLLALAAPFLFARAEVREAQRRFLGIDPDTVPLGLGTGGAARLGLADGSAGGSSPADNAVAVRSSHALAERDRLSAERWQRGARLADRYGRSLGSDTPPVPRQPPAPARAVRRRVGGVPELPDAPPAAGLHRSADSYHGSYNDYLWQLALADGELSEMPSNPLAAPVESAAPALEAPIDHATATDDEAR